MTQDDKDVTQDDKEMIYEFACHEGNHGLPGILSAARATEKAAQKGSRCRPKVIPS